MGRSVISIMIGVVLLGCLVGSEAVGDANYTIAEWANYSAEQHDWNLTEVGVECSTWNASASYEWRSKYNWTAYCDPCGPLPIGQEACGKCLNVTNANTGDQIIVRIVDVCGIGGLILDKPAFDQIDSDACGALKGYLIANYVVVDCEDDDDTKIRLYSGQ